MRPGDRRRLRLMLERCPVPPGGAVVEVGCGTGRLLRELALELPGRRLLGLDPAASMLRQGRGHELLQGAAEALPLAACSLDLVFASLAFHHFGDQPAAAGELHRVLRTGGYMAIWTGTPEHVRSFPLNRWFPSIETIDLARFPPPERWMAMLARAGFATVAAQQFRVRRSPTMGWLAAAVRERYLSTFDRVPDPEYRQGLARLEAEAAAAPGRRIDYSMGWSLIWARKS